MYLVKSFLLCLQAGLINFYENKRSNNGLGIQVIESMWITTVTECGGYVE
jgi:hypothetical protein